MAALNRAGLVPPADSCVFSSVSEFKIPIDINANIPGVTVQFRTHRDSTIGDYSFLVGNLNSFWRECQ